ncbi:hypothetical protein PR202_ga29552 [Eleusine coracana subsp. coracana]|uniref:Uncharacterized protein n=1 Tax=Eleusine coracana subsp. coracana TaxID=191504 RepID=A0AAV5DMC2_ELECO|nr:hypothetical protein PR202_ga29552 [Eleusine coracana subsp. coracana]
MTLCQSTNLQGQLRNLSPSTEVVERKPQPLASNGLNRTAVMAPVPAAQKSSLEVLLETIKKQVTANSMRIDKKTDVDKDIVVMEAKEEKAVKGRIFGAKRKFSSAEVLDESPYVASFHENRKGETVCKDPPSVSSTTAKMNGKPVCTDIMDYVLEKKLRVWCSSPNTKWELGQIQSLSGDDAEILLSNGMLLTMSPERLLPANPDILDGVDDLIQMSYLNEPSVLYNLQLRYSRDLIYTKAGPVLIAVNPLKDVALYGNTSITQYKQKIKDDPHVYAVADLAFNEMLQGRWHKPIHNNKVMVKVEQGKLRLLKLLCNIFGCCRGVLAEWSPRFFRQMLFWKHWEMQKHHETITQVDLENLLRYIFLKLGRCVVLESRPSNISCLAHVVEGGSKGTRREIIPYFLSAVLWSSSLPKKYLLSHFLILLILYAAAEKLFLKNASEYNYLKHSNCLRIDGVDDANKFSVLVDALDTIKISKEDQTKLFSMLAVVLWLGNISFSVIDNENHVEVVSNEGLATAAKLLGCTTNQLVIAMSTRKIRAGNDNIVKKLTLTQKNGFEQFCINYANERLQQHFNRHLFKLQQEEYLEDGIDWATVEFVDNTNCLSLFEKVTYDTTGFLEKNRDPLHSESIQLLSSCKSELPKHFASVMVADSQNKSTLSWHSVVDTQKQSVVTKFKVQLFKLMQQLENTSPHFIRCIQPNSKQSPGLFEHNLVLHQLKCCGVLEVVRISRTGYPTRMTHQQFAERYGFLLLRPLASQDPLSVSIAVLQQLNIPPEMYQVGYTKLFFRTGQIAVLENSEKQMLHGTIHIQRHFRGLQSRKGYRELKKVAMTLQSFIRGERARIHFDCLVKRWKAAILIQKYTRRRLAIAMFSDQLKHIILLQSVTRGCLARKKYQCLQNEKESTVIRKVQGNTRKTVSDSRVCLLSVVAAKKSLASDEVASRVARSDAAPTPTHAQYDSEDTLSTGTHTPELVEWRHHNYNPESKVSAGNSDRRVNAVNHLAKEFEDRRQVFEDDAGFLVAVRSGQVGSNMNPDEELRKLKDRFATWKKDYKSRLKETKVNLHKGGTHDEKSRKRWWGKKSSK